MFFFYKGDIVRLTSFYFQLGMWVKGCQEFPHANQEINNVVESYHCYLKTTFLSDRRKKCAWRMDWLLHMLLTIVEPCYRFKEILKEEGFLNNYKREKQLESSVERARKLWILIVVLMRA